MLIRHRHRPTPHVWVTSLAAQARHAAGTREVLERHFECRPIWAEHLFARGGNLAGVGAPCCPNDDVIGSSDCTSKFKSAQ